MALPLGDSNRDDLGVQRRVEISLDHTQIFLGLREYLLHRDHARNIAHGLIGIVQAPVVLDALFAHRQEARVGGELGGALNDMTEHLARTQQDLAARNTELATALENLQASRQRLEVLEQLKGELSKFVPDAVKELLERDPSATQLEKRQEEVSVLFLDIAGYTRLSEQVEAKRLNQLVQTYFSAFLEIIRKHQGDVNETAGDGLMVIFQDPDPRRHAVAAALAGLGVLRRTAEINAAMDAEPGPPAEPIGVHVGVNSGVAAVGATRIEGLAGTRWTYTASGPVTNVAARLAALGFQPIEEIQPSRHRVSLALAGRQLGRQIEADYQGKPLTIVADGRSSTIASGSNDTIE